MLRCLRNIHDDREMTGWADLDAGVLAVDFVLPFADRQRVAGPARIRAITTSPGRPHEESGEVPNVKTFPGTRSVATTRLWYRTSSPGLMMGLIPSPRNN